MKLYFLTEDPFEEKSFLIKQKCVCKHCKNVLFTRTDLIRIHITGVHCSQKAVGTGCKKIQVFMKNKASP